MHEIAKSAGLDIGRIVRPLPQRIDKPSAGTFNPAVWALELKTDDIRASGDLTTIGVARVTSQILNLGSDDPLQLTTGKRTLTLQVIAPPSVDAGSFGLVGLP